MAFYEEMWSAQMKPYNIVYGDSRMPNIKPQPLTMRQPSFYLTGYIGHSYVGGSDEDPYAIKPQWGDSPTLEFEDWKASVNEWTGDWEIFHKHNLLGGHLSISKYTAADNDRNYWIGPCYENDHGEYICSMCHIQDLTQPPEQMITLMNLQKLKGPQKPTINEPVAPIWQTFYIVSSDNLTGMTGNASGDYTILS
jgi:hypothetical protein